MPRVTLNGKAPAAPAGPRAPGGARGARPATAPQSIADTLANAIAQGNTIDPALLQNAQFSPNFHSPAGQAAVNRAALDQVISAIQATRRGGGADAVQRAQQGLGLMRSAGVSASASVTNAEAALQRVIAREASRPSGGALVPYRAGQVPAVYRSNSTGFTTSGGPYTPDSASRDVTRYLRTIDASTRQSARVESLAWDRQKQLLLPSPLGIPRAPGAWTNVGPQRPSFVPPGTPFPQRGPGAPWAPAFVPPGMGGIGVPPGPPPPGPPTNPPNPPRPPNPPPNPSPGGGGGFGRSRRGYGWGRAASRLPYVGGPLSNIIEAGALGGPWGAAAAAAVEALDAAAFPRQTLGDAAAANLGRAMPFISLQRDAFAIGRAGDYSGSDTLRQFYNGNETPDLMKAFGATAPEAMRQLQRFGIVQTDPGANAALFQALNVPMYSRAFSGLNQDAVQGSAANAAAYGIIGSDAASVTRYFNMMGTVMEGATARGMDRAAILHSIDTSMTTAAQRGAAGINATQTADFIGRFANMPGGRTGEVGASVAASLDQAAGLVGSAPAQSLAYALATRRYTTQASLEGLMGGKLTGAQQDIAGFYFQALKAGDTPAAAKYLSEITKGSPQASSAILAGPGSPASMMPGYRGPIATAAAEGISVGSAVQQTLHPHSVISTGSPMPGGSVSLGSTPDPAFDEKKISDYTQGLLRMGVRHDLIPILISEGRKAGINPLLGGAAMMGESSGGFDANAGPNVMQVKGSSGLVKSGSDITSPQQSIALGFQVEKTMLARSGGDVTKMHAGYEGPTWGTDANVAYEARIRNAYAAAGFGEDSNIPTAGNAVTAGAGAATMSGSEASMNNGALMIPAFNASLNSAGIAVDNFAAKMKKANDSMDWYRSATPLGGGLGSIP